MTKQAYGFLVVIVLAWIFAMTNQYGWCNEIEKRPPSPDSSQAFPKKHFRKSDQASIGSSESTSANSRGESAHISDDAKTKDGDKPSIKNKDEKDKIFKDMSSGKDRGGSHGGNVGD